MTNRDRVDNNEVLGWGKYAGSTVAKAPQHLSYFKLQEQAQADPSGGTALDQSNQNAVSAGTQCASSNRRCRGSSGRAADESESRRPCLIYGHLSRSDSRHGQDGIGAVETRAEHSDLKGDDTAALSLKKQRRILRQVQRLMTAIPKHAPSLTLVASGVNAQMTCSVSCPCWQQIQVVNVRDAEESMPGTECVYVLCNKDEVREWIERLKGTEGVLWWYVVVCVDRTIEIRASESRCGEILASCLQRHMQEDPSVSHDVASLSHALSVACLCDQWKLQQGNVQTNEHVPCVSCREYLGVSKEYGLWSQASSPTEIVSSLTASKEESGAWDLVFAFEEAEVFLCKMLGIHELCKLSMLLRNAGQ